jgi:mycofactocin system transcriptional regulator
VRPVPTAVPVARAGRKRVTSRADLEHVAFDLFDRQGFERTTVDDIARAAGIGRRTFFRYFPSKNDVPWGNFDAELDRMRLRLKALPPQMPLMEAIRVAIVDFNTFAPEQIGWHRRRMRLILQTPALQAHSTLRYAAWRRSSTSSSASASASVRTHWLRGLSATSPSAWRSPPTNSGSKPTRLTSATSWTARCASSPPPSATAWRPPPRASPSPRRRSARDRPTGTQRLIGPPLLSA